MLLIKVILMGKLKEPYLRDGCTEYIKRLSAYCKTEVVELSPVKLPNNPSDSEIKRALSQEGAEILKAAAGSFMVSLCIEGKQYTSEQLADLLDSTALQHSAISFIIGSSHGLAPEVTNASHLKLSLSKMTFPHQLARLMLLEQIYRGFSISKGGKYHK